MPNIVPIARAVLCTNCLVISDSTGEVCAHCACPGGLLHLARILNPNPELGEITYVYAQGEA